mmetsp:Transcript_16448/g.42190  ORF Transcript_16448/g.42190 Transcript_16448/m.42190 type:complete len:339 (+) Transcript_16448:18-1034(+)
MHRSSLLLVPLLASACAGYRPAGSHQAGWRGLVQHHMRCIIVANEADPITPPVALRCLSRQDVVDKLNAVPVFSIVNGADQMLATPDQEGELTCRFYLEIDEAQRACESLQVANPRTNLQLAITPLGTAFALSEWRRSMDDEVASQSSGARRRAEGDGMDDYDDEEDVEDDDDVDATEVQLQASVDEVESVGSLLKQSPAPPLLRRRNTRKGPIPLFGSDALRFQLPMEGSDEVRPMTPLFFRRSDLLSAWAASGGTPDKLPSVQVTDLRTVAWQMQFDAQQDWSPMLFVAPEPAIDFVKQQQEELANAQPTPDVKLTAADAQGLIFGSDPMPRGSFF